VVHYHHFNAHLPDKPQGAVWDAESGGSREYILRGNVDARVGRGTFGTSVQLKSILKYRIWRLGKTVSCAKNTWTDLNNLCDIWCDFAQEVALWWSLVAMIAPVLKFLLAVIFICG